MTIGRNIQKARLRADLTQDRLAQLVSVSEGYITFIETGRRRPSLKVLEKIAKRTNTEIADLVKGDRVFARLFGQLAPVLKQLDRELEVTK
jgi:transcriptional regulator with XRE-family HTH domain